MNLDNLELSQTIDIGQFVQCDWCDTVFREQDGTTLDDRSGGFLFGGRPDSPRSGKATGPCCAARMEANIASFGETNYIGERCPDGVPFADWVLALRGPENNNIRIYTEPRP